VVQIPPEIFAWGILLVGNPSIRQ